MTENIKIKTRFAPSPTGHLHVGSARTALFCYLLARQTGGTFLLRIEDTDRARHVEGAIEQITEDLKWLGIDWDEGPARGGDFGPYMQSERLDIYNTHIDRLLAEGKAYYAFDTAEELDAMRTEAQERKENFSYPRPATLPTKQDADAAASQGRPVVVRFLCPDGDVTISDEVYGEITVPADQQDDFIIRKADGWPTYHLANVVDDALMGVNFILRGQEFLGQSWRHKRLREAFGWAEPRYAHLPLIMDMQGRKLSKRDGDVDIFSFRKAGYLPEAMVSFIALLGFSPALADGEGERLPLKRLIELFDVKRIGKSNAKFDREKLLAFNRDSSADAAGSDSLTDAFEDYLANNETPIPTGNRKLAAKLLEINAGFKIFGDIIEKSGILFADDDSYEFDEKAVKKVLDKGEPSGWENLAGIAECFADESLQWTADALENCVHEYCTAKEIGMGKVAQPIRVAVTGRTVSPALGETLVLLGREKTLKRINRCLSTKSPE